ATVCRGCHDLFILQANLGRKEPLYFGLLSPAEGLGIPGCAVRTVTFLGKLRMRVPILVRAELTLVLFLRNGAAREHGEIGGTDAGHLLRTIQFMTITLLKLRRNRCRIEVELADRN